MCSAWQDPKDQKRYCGNRLTKRGVIAVALVVAVLVFVIALAASIPSIGYSLASSAVADADMQITRLDVLTMTDDALHIRLQGSVINKANLDGTMSEFDMTIYYKGELVRLFSLPRLCELLANAPSTGRHRSDAAAVCQGQRRDANGRDDCPPFQRR